MPATNRTGRDNQKVTSAIGGAAVTPGDTSAADFVYISRALWVGGAGAIAIVTESGDVITLAGVPAGTLLPIRATRINATNTTATLIVALT